MMLYQSLSISMILFAMRSAMKHQNRYRHSCFTPYRYCAVNGFQLHISSIRTTKSYCRHRGHVPSNIHIPNDQLHYNLPLLALKLQNRCTPVSNDRIFLNRPSQRMMSVSGVIYDVDSDNDTAKERDHETGAIVVTLFTKEGCTLCDKAQDVLQSLRSKYPHKLVAVDITDPISKEQWYEKYKYDIPVLHVNNNPSTYWAKHRITPEQAEQCFQDIQNGISITPIGTEPNAANSRPKGSDSNS